MIARVNEKVETIDVMMCNAIYIQVSKSRKQLRNAAIITVGYTLVSNRLASRNAVAANAETQSQSKYEDFVSQSDFWERQQNTSMLIAAEITSTFFLCRTLRKSMSSQILPLKVTNQITSCKLENPR